jgi:hypothetical protein
MKKKTLSKTVHLHLASNERSLNKKKDDTNDDHTLDQQTRNCLSQKEESISQSSAPIQTSVVNVLTNQRAWLSNRKSSVGYVRYDLNNERGSKKREWIFTVFKNISCDKNSFTRARSAYWYEKKMEQASGKDMIACKSRQWKTSS